jgi:hypothetical protein
MAEYQLVNASASPEVQMNENMESIEYAFVYGRKQPTSSPPGASSANWGYYGGRWGGFTVASGVLSLLTSNPNYIVVDMTTGAISSSFNSGPGTNWDNPSRYLRVYKVTLSGYSVTAVEDHRAGPYGVHGRKMDYVVSGTCNGVATANHAFIVHPFQSPVVFKAAVLPFYRAYARVAATAITAIDIRKRTLAGVETSIGTISFAAGGTTATFTFAADVSFAAGDIMIVVGGAVADTTLASIGIHLKGFG